MKTFSFKRLKSRIGCSLRGRSINELSSFFVKLLLLGSVLTMATYILTNRLVSHYQKIFTEEVLPIIAVQRDIEVDLVDYAMLEASIRQHEAAQVYSESIRRLSFKSTHNLQILDRLVQDEPSLSVIKERLDELSLILINSINDIYSLQVSYLANKEKLKHFKKEMQVAVEQLIILREGFSGKITLNDVLRQRSNLESHHELLQANLLLGIRLSELTNNISILMYVDDIDQLLDMNSHQISENLQQVKKSIDKLMRLDGVNRLARELRLNLDQMLVNLNLVEAGLSNKAALTLLIKGQFENEASLGIASREFRGSLVSIQNELTGMYLISEVMVNNSIVKNEQLSFISTLVLLFLLAIFVAALIVLIVVITSQIDRPSLS